ncbi:tRNA (mnm(5)s(2)U34)-methyltransferase [Megamonas hypermegale]|uniref:tRNA (mnm(5)s(2)U34)-methyltransferase n=1 Tax=Megamonas hypermegale TaxID=158847 RepID=UPI0026F3544C|nr:class I SAM-dependent methyltransferase [Megamonas hypermegale]
MQVLSNSVQISHTLLKAALDRAQIVVDATAGNGNDTLFLAQNARRSTVIYAFDIQAQALCHARKKMHEFFKRDDIEVNFIHASHDEVAQYVNGSIDLAVFNLGYLPGGDHAVTTKCETTLNALKIMLEKLRRGGHIAVVVYPGHAEGLKESQLIKDFAASLAKKYFTVGWYQMINHNNNAPALCWIEKVGE